MQKNWSKISLHFDPDIDKEVLIAWLDVYEVDSIVEYDDYFEVYCAKEKVEELIKHIEVNDALQIDSIAAEVVENKNWNAVWESNFEPITINDLSIRATFHDPLGTKEELVISPKMAFGTGHHATTYMMIEQMQSLGLSGDRVLDYGCGTGILAVYALMCGAEHVDAIDIQEEAIENTLEHLDLNSQSRDKATVQQCDIMDMPVEQYNTILANINHGVLSQNRDELYNRLKDDGRLLISGILIEDQDRILAHYLKGGFYFCGHEQRGEWSLLSFTKTS